ncbi:MAG: cytochrome C biogenesis protein CcmH [Betaproteobacteria bacterium HGW-Betaproteobacteria-11]|nr:MAG: cytochrome C biogenesis protein CcmH [Betaproteobacteria bacterium HGW-Betaproteobacteria-11]
MKAWRFLLVLLAVGFSGLAPAKEAVPLAADEAVEKRLLAISEELRCLVCQNETLAASRADLAQDLRREIRQMIHEGKNDKEIIDFMVARYGDFVLYRPPLKPATWLLWGGPFVLLGGGLWALIAFLRRQKLQAAPPLSAADHARARALLEATDPTDTP